MTNDSPRPLSLSSVAAAFNATLPLPVPTEQKMRYIARELAMDMDEPRQIIDKIGMDVAEWDAIIQNPRFKDMLREEKERWGSALNSKERIEIKTLYIIEDALEQMQSYLLSPTFGDTAKVQLYQALQKQVGIGSKDGPVAGTGERISITINMGDEEVKATHDVTPQGNGITIEGTAVEEGK
jgi:hypothetical protein